MKIVKLSDSLAVSGQITEADIEEIVAAGYRVLISNRPDGEEGNQPHSAAIADAARAAGMEFHHLPVTAMDFPGPHYQAMSDLLDDPTRPVLAFCRTGTRCTNLWVVGCEGADRDIAIAVARQLGFDLAMAERFLAS
ncbi:MAG: TIGR01244 family sulfur transferase [Halioglobus sp.]